MATIADASENGERTGTTMWFDIVRAGWLERWRTHPPLWRWLSYRLFGTRLPPQWKAWMLDDVRGFVGLRTGLIVASACELPLAAMSIKSQLSGNPTAPLGTLWLIGPMMLAVSSAQTGRIRRQILNRHGLRATKDGSVALIEPTFGPEYEPWRPRPRRVVRTVPMLSLIGLSLTAAVPIGVVASMFPEVLPRSISLGLLTVGREPLDHQWGAGMAVLIASVVLGVAAIALVRWRLPGVLRSLIRREPPATAVSWVWPTLWRAGLVLIAAVAGLTRTAPMIVPGIVYLLGGVGPAMLYAAARIQRFETQAGQRAWSTMALGQAIAQETETHGVR